VCAGVHIRSACLRHGFLTQPAATHTGAQHGSRPRGAQGAALYAQQWRGLWAKRALSARRDRLAVVTQLAVPVALVLLALWTRKASSAFPQEPALALSRCGRARAPARGRALL